MNAITAYQFCKLVNTLLQTSLPPQMFYTYVRKGITSTSPAMIQTVEVNGKRLITRAEAERWLRAYCTRNNIQVPGESKKEEEFSKAVEIL